MRKTAILFCALLLTALCLCPRWARAKEAEATAPLPVEDLQSLAAALDLAKERSDVAMRLQLMGELELCQRVEVTENVELILHSGARLIIRTEDGKLTVYGAISLEGGELDIQEEGRLLNYGALRLQGGSLSVAGRLWCYDGSRLEVGEGARLAVEPGGALDLRESATLRLETTLENEGRIEAEEGLAVEGTSPVRNLGEGSCQGLDLDVQEGCFQVRNLDGLRALAAVAEAHPERTYAPTLVRTLRLREELCLPANLELTLESDLELRATGCLIAYGPLRSSGGKLYAEGEYLLLGGLKTEELLVEEEGASPLALSGLTVQAPLRLDYDLLTDDAWDLEGGSVQPVTEDGRQLPSTPLTVEMLPDYAALAQELGERWVCVQWGGLEELQAFQACWTCCLDGDSQRERGFLVEDGAGQARAVVAYALEDEQRLALEQAARAQGMQADTYAFVRLELAEQGNTTAGITLRLYPENGEAEGSWLLLRLEEDGKTAQRYEALGNGHSYSCNLQGLGCLAIGLNEEETTGQPAETQAEAGTTSPAPIATETEPVQTAVEAQTPEAEGDPALPAPTLSAQDADASKEDLEESAAVQGYGLILGAAFLLLIAAAAIYAMKTSGKD